MHIVLAVCQHHGAAEVKCFALASVETSDSKGKRMIDAVCSHVTILQLCDTTPKPATTRIQLTKVRAALIFEAAALSSGLPMRGNTVALTGATTGVNRKTTRASFPSPCIHTHTPADRQTYDR